MGDCVSNKLLCEICKIPHNNISFNLCNKHIKKRKILVKNIIHLLKVLCLTEFLY